MRNLKRFPVLYLVKPEFNDIIERRYEKLTGITTKDVQEAPVFTNALEMFLRWCSNINDEIQIWQWSESDYNQIAKEIELKKCSLTEKERKLLSEWRDLQKEFDDVIGLERQQSLSNAIMYAGADFEGRQHDALHDARNTAHLFRIMKNSGSYSRALENVINAFKPKSINTAIGDMFDFGKIILPA